MDISLKDKVKIIFVDIDWTILNHHNRDWDYESINGLKEAQNSGIKVFLATARPYDSVKHTGLLDIFTPDGIICTNGAIAFYNDKLIYEDIFPIDVCKNIFEVADKYDLVIEYSTPKERYFNKDKNKAVVDYFSIFYETYPPIKPYETSDKICAILLFAPLEIDEVYKKDLLPEINPYRFDNNGVDVHTHETNKAIALNYVLSYLNIDKENTMSFGDDIGDIEMFKSTKYSVCLENGKPEAKEVAYFVTKSIDENGVSYALKHFHIID